MKTSLSLLVAAAFMTFSVPAFACGDHAEVEAENVSEVTASTSEKAETKAKTTKKAKSKKADTKKADTKKADTKA